MIDRIFISAHPLVSHKLSLMRDADCPTKRFRELLKECGTLLAYEATAGLALTYTDIETSAGTVSDAQVLKGKKLAIVPVLRAGLAMAEGVLQSVPSARIGHIGINRRRNEDGTYHAVDYLTKLPNPADRDFILVDPIIATGITAVYAADILNRFGVEDERIRFIALLGAREGVERLTRCHPGLTLHIGAIDENEVAPDGSIMPGLGDVGDRAFGTL